MEIYGHGDIKNYTFHNYLDSKSTLLARGLMRFFIFNFLCLLYVYFETYTL